jgi:kinesin family protein 11
MPACARAQVRILEDRGGVVLHGLEEAAVRRAADVYELLEAGSARRRTAETLLNKTSSRSHR